MATLQVSSGGLNIVNSDYDLPKSEGHKLDDSQVTYYSDIDKDKVGTEDTVREMENLMIQDNIQLNKIYKVSENNANSQNPTKMKTASRDIPSTNRDTETTIDLADNPEGQASYLGSQNNTKNKVDVFPQRSSLRSRVSHELENNIDRNREMNIDDYNDPEAPQVYNRRRDYLLDDRFVENTNYHPSENLLCRRGIRERNDNFDFLESRSRNPDMDYPDLENFEENYYKKKEPRQTPIQDPFTRSTCCCESRSRDRQQSVRNRFPPRVESDYERNQLLRNRDSLRFSRHIPEIPHSSRELSPPFQDYDYGSPPPTHKFRSCSTALRSTRPHVTFDPTLSSNNYQSENRSFYRNSRNQYRRESAPPSPAVTYDIMRKWNLKFSGSREEDAENYLTRLNEGGAICPVDDEVLLRLLPFFLLGIALSWYRSMQSTWRTFDQFASAFRSRFSDSDFQFELRQEIHKRTQGPRESVADYLTCMLAMYDRLEPPLSESEEISYAHKNLLPRLQLTIPCHRIYS